MFGLGRRRGAGPRVSVTGSGSGAREGDSASRASWEAQMGRRGNDGNKEKRIEDGGLAAHVMDDQAEIWGKNMMHVFCLGC